MAEWYLATYQNGVFLNKLGIIQPSGDYAYELKNGIQSTKSPVKSDWLRITIADNKVEKWDSGSWTQDTSLTVLVNNSTCWVYGSPFAYYTIITNSQVYYLDNLNNMGTITDVTAITAVTIGPSVTSIGYKAFYLCSSLASVTIGDSVETIGSSAFQDCSSLASVTIGDSVTSIGDYAFQFCSSLASLNIPDSVTKIGDHAFDECSILKSVNIPDSVETIGSSAFSQCTSLAYVTIGDSVTSISDHAFFGIKSNAIITISQDTVRRLMDDNKYNSGTKYSGETFFSDTTTVTLNVI